MRPFIAIESPYGSPKLEEIKWNILLAQRVCKIAVSKGNVPIASHLFFPQFLNDEKEEDRQLGIKLGFETVNKLRIRQVWMVLRDGENLSRGMLQALTEHMNYHRYIRYFRTADNGVTIREVTSFMEVQNGHAQKTAEES